MKKFFSALALMFMTYCLYAQQQESSNPTTQAQGPVIKIKDGTLHGVKDGDVESFKGIPYAAPPVGEYRWRPPQPVTPWQGVRDASNFGATCAAAGWGAAAGSIQQGSSEDCLFLNIWRPAGAASNAKLPVMVWIHGGAFVGGSGNTSGDGFAKQGVISQAMNKLSGFFGKYL